MIVLKFGGTSLGSPKLVKKACEIVVKAKKENKAVAMVCSAFGGATNTLLNIGELAAQRNKTEYLEQLASLKQRHREAISELVTIEQAALHTQIEKLFEDLEDLFHGIYLLREVSPRTNDFVVSFGERLSSMIIAASLKTQLGEDVHFLDARRVIKTDDRFGRARVNFEKTNQLIAEHFANDKRFQVVTGFIGSTDKDQVTTLGRGGSDYTVSIIGSALGVDEIQIWTDVNGVMTADPRKVASAMPVTTMSYEEAMEMSHFGAKVIYPPTMAPAMAKNIPITIKNTYEPEHPGTLIGGCPEPEASRVRGLTSVGEIALLQLKGTGMIGVEGVSSRVFNALANKEVNVILISQASSEYSICVAVEPNKAEIAQKAIDDAFSYEILLKQIEPVRVERSLSIIAMVGEGMRRQPGISGRLFGALGRHGVNVHAIAQGSSELNVSIVVGKKDVDRAVNVIHENFFGNGNTTGLYLVGPGLIGKELMEQYKQWREKVQETYGRKLLLVGVANSRKMIFDRDGLEPEQVITALAERGEPMAPADFLARIKGMAMAQSVLVDCTASDTFAEVYEDALKMGISIATPNKKANTGRQARFDELAALSKPAHLHFLYEANVGAGLPVISTIKNMVDSGDRITRIEAVLSGTLSYIFNSFNEDIRFSEVVRVAREKGFTEPDPREDLNGMDVARKLLILARESGISMEMEELSVESLIPSNCEQAQSAEEFMELLPGADAFFSKKLENALSNGKRLRYIATLENGKGSVALRAVDAEHPCYSLTANDNLVSISSERYATTPLVVRGPGAGAAVTAAQVFAEVIRIAQLSPGS